MANTSTSSWGAARNVCQNLGADLVVIKSEEESQFVNNVMKKNNIDRLWIGMERKTHDNKFYWIDGSPAYRSNFTYTNWNKNEPNNQGNQENCGEVLTSIKKWNDVSCSSTTHFVLCQKPGISNSKG